MVDLHKTCAGAYGLHVLSPRACKFQHFLDEKVAKKHSGEHVEKTLRRTLKKSGNVLKSGADLGGPKKIPKHYFVVFQVPGSMWPRAPPQAASKVPNDTKMHVRSGVGRDKGTVSRHMFLEVDNYPVVFFQGSG